MNPLPMLFQLDLCAANLGRRSRTVGEVEKKVNLNWSFPTCTLSEWKATVCFSPIPVRSSPGSDRAWNPTPKAFGASIPRSISESLTRRPSRLVNSRSAAVLGGGARQIALLKNSKKTVYPLFKKPWYCQTAFASKWLPKAGKPGSFPYPKIMVL